MICPKCGTDNRAGASYCDSCGEMLGPHADPLTLEENLAGERKPVLDAGGLTGFMAADWLIRFVLVGVIGFLAGILLIGMGEYGASAFFFFLGVVGVAGTWYMLHAKA